MKRILYCTKLFIDSFLFLGKAKGKYIIGTLFSSLELVLLFLIPFFYKTLINNIAQEQYAFVVYELIKMLCVFLLLVPFIVYGKYTQTKAVDEGTANLKKLLFQHISQMPYEAITKYKSGDYIIRFTNDVKRTTGVFGSFVIVCLLRFLVVFPVTLVLLFFNDWKLAIVGILYGVITLMLSAYLNPYVKRLDREAKDEVVKAASFLFETLRDLPIIRVFLMRDVLAQRYHAISNKIKEKHKKYRSVMGITYGIIDFFSLSGQAVGFIIGFLLAGKNANLSECVFTATLMGMMGDSFLRLSTFLLLSQSSFVSMERIFELFHIQTEAIDSKMKPIENDVEDLLIFRNVFFSYNNNTPVLKGIDLKLKRGEYVAIVGESGCGKSTILKLMEGFYPPTKGNIYYWGMEESKLSKSEIRQLFSYVPQECVLFDGTIGENIALGKEGTTREKIINAASLVNINHFIENLPAQYDTQVGERGGQLSGGQKQRIALARAIVNDTPILLLDEPTSFLDAASERDIQRCLELLAKEKTIVMVAHRLTTLSKVDRILVMEKGKIVEEGSFQELLQKQGVFRRLYENQTIVEHIDSN